MPSEPQPQERTITDEFDAWLSVSLPEKTPPGVVAYLLGIHELVDAKTRVEHLCIGLIGTETYDVDDDDWACEGIWNPTSSGFLIGYEVFDNDWESAQASVAAMIARFIHLKLPGSAVLRQSQCVATGFLDGDLITVWPTH